MGIDFVKRAWLRLIRRPAYTVIHTAIFAVVCAMMLSGLVIQEAAARTARDAARQVGVVVTMSFDLNAYLEKQDPSDSGGGTHRLGDVRALDKTLADAICRSEVVESCNYGNQAAAYPSSSLALFDPAGAGKAKSDIQTGLFTVKGVRELDTVSAFRSGDARIVSGTGLTAASGADEIVIEERLAQQNGIAVGDEVELFVGELGPDGTQADPKPHAFRVVGIYHSDTASGPEGTPAISQAANLIFASNGAASTLGGFDTAGKIDQATFILRQPDDLHALRADARNAGADLDIYPLSVNSKEYETLIGPIQRTAALATLIVWSAIVAGVVVLVLTVASAARARRREVGVLLSLGERKRRVLGQQILELTVCALLGVGVAVGASQVLAPAIGSAVLAGQVASASDSSTGPQKDLSDPNGGYLPPDQKPIDSIDVQVSLSQIGIVGATALGITAVSVIVPGTRLARLHPRDILTKGA
jgi:putative ABC transport system permease protein